MPKSQKLREVTFRGRGQNALPVIKKNPYCARSLAFGAWVIARLAGWSGYQSQGSAGPTDFFTGLQRFYEQWQGFLLFNQCSFYNKNVDLDLGLEGAKNG